CQRSLDVWLLPYGQHLTADQPGVRLPAGEADDDDQHQEAAAENGHGYQGDQYEWNGELGVHGSHDQFVDAAAGGAGNHAQYRADDQADHGAEGGNQDRGAQGVDYAAEQVTAEF